MATLVPVDHDPFAESAPSAASTTPSTVAEGAAKLVPVDHDPFAPAAPSAKAAPASKPPALADEPGYEYGSVLPVRQKIDAQGKPIAGSQEWAWPEFIRAPVRGVQEIGGKASGSVPMTPGDVGVSGASGLSSDAMAALGVAAMPFGTATAPARQVAADAAAGVLAKNAPSAEARAAAKELGVVTRAGEIVSRRANQDVKAAGTSAQEVIDNMTRQRGLGKPVTLLDTGANVRSLAGSVARKPGESQGVISNFLEQRDARAADRLRFDIGRDLTGQIQQGLDRIGVGPSAYRTVKQLVETRQAEAQPLYDKAFEGGSVAPLKNQFEAAFADASGAVQKAENDLASARANLTAVRSRATLSDSVHATAASNDATRRAETAVRQATAVRDQAIGAKDQVLERLRLAQADIENGTPGAVWNPRIQQFLDDPVMRRGMARGVEIQRLEALAAGRPFNPTELALTPEGEVISVPNMRTLDAGKKGLDAIIESEGRDEYGRLNQYGRAVDQVRRSFLSEVDRVNPDYAAARQSWSGHSASLDAVKLGKNITRLNPEQIAEDFAALTPGDQEFARLGAADALVERIAKTGFGGDEAKAVVKNEWAKGQLKPLFRTEADFQRFVDSVTAEREMFETKRVITGNSETAPRQAEDAGNDLAHAGLHAAHGVVQAAHGRVMSALRSAMNAYDGLGIRNNEDLNAEIARMLSDLAITPTVENSKVVVSRPLGGPRP